MECGASAAPHIPKHLSTHMPTHTSVAFLSKLMEARSQSCAADTADSHNDVKSIHVVKHHQTTRLNQLQARELYSEKAYRSISHLIHVLEGQQPGSAVPLDA